MTQLVGLLTDADCRNKLFSIVNAVIKAGPVHILTLLDRFLFLLLRLASSVLDLYVSQTVELVR